MPNTDVFNQFDMVVSVKQDAINHQLAALRASGTIHPQLIIVAEPGTPGNYDYVVLNPGDPIPPNCPYISGTITPSVAITASGTFITFVLNFTAGTAMFWDLDGPPVLKSYDMTGWSYGVGVNMGLAQMAAADIAAHKGIPQNVKDQLTNWTSADFSVQALFMDFQSTDLMQYNPTLTNAGSAGDKGIDQLVIFMNQYLNQLQKAGSPYFLGYSISATPSSSYPSGQVPAVLQPAGATYTMYADSVTPGDSNLNFLLVTKGGYGTVPTFGPTFGSNWFAPGEQCDGKMIVRSACLTEPLLLEPFYQSFSDAVWGQINGQVDVNPPNSYQAAKSATAAGFAYTISNQTDPDADDQYGNTFSANFGPNATIALSGQVQVYKEVHRNMGFCTAKGWAWSNASWVGQLGLRLAGTNIVPTSVPSTANPQSGTGKNDCAKAWSIIGEILGGLLSIFTGFTALDFFMNLFGNLLGIDVPNIGNISTALLNFSSSVSGVVVLPAGDVFTFQSVELGALGETSFEISYPKKPLKLYRADAVEAERELVTA
jgi:hypothetical protein